MTATLHIHITDKTLEALHPNTAHKLVEAAAAKFRYGSRTGKFNRYLTADKQREAKRFLVLFESETKVHVMTYDEALSLPTLAKKCKETWND